MHATPVLKGTLIYIRNILLTPLALADFALNAVTGGSPFETVSRRAGRVKAHYGGIPKHRYFLRFVDWLTEKFDENHLLEAAGHKIGSMGVIDKEML